MKAILKHLATLLAIALIVSFADFNIAQAENTQFMEVLVVSGDNVNLRSSPVKGDNIIKTIDITTVAFKLDDGENGFYHVSVDGNEGYMHKDYLKPVTIEIPEGYSIIGSCITIFKEDGNRSTNIQLACQGISGTWVSEYGRFSYNDTLGPRTAKKGYKEAPVIIRGNMDTGIGGGICQVSSTLYKACLNAGIAFSKGDRTHHPLKVSYTRWKEDGIGGFDATVNWPNIDFQFTNSIGQPITIFAGTSYISSSKSACWVLICVK